MHSEIVLREDVQIFGELFVEIADAFVEKSLFADALPIYELLLEGNTVRILSIKSSCSLEVNELSGGKYRPCNERWGLLPLLESIRPSRKYVFMGCVYNSTSFDVTYGDLNSNQHRCTSPRGQVTPSRGL